MGKRSSCINWDYIKDVLFFHYVRGFPPTEVVVKLNDKARRMGISDKFKHFTEIMVTKILDGPFSEEESARYGEWLENELIDHGMESPMFSLKGNIILPTLDVPIVPANPSGHAGISSTKQTDMFSGFSKARDITPVMRGNYNTEKKGSIGFLTTILPSPAKCGTFANTIVSLPRGLLETAEWKMAEKKAGKSGTLLGVKQDKDRPKIYYFYPLAIDNGFAPCRQGNRLWPYTLTVPHRLPKETSEFKAWLKYTVRVYAPNWSVLAMPEGPGFYVACEAPEPPSHG